MSYQLTLDGKDEAKTLLEMYKEKIKGEKQQIAIHERNIRAMNEKVIQLTRFINGTPELSVKGYNHNWQWVKKIEFALNYANRPLTTSEIVDLILTFEPTLERKKAMGSISGTISTKSSSVMEDDKEFLRKENENGDYVYEMMHPFSPSIAVIQTTWDCNLEDLPF